MSRTRRPVIGRAYPRQGADDYLTLVVKKELDTRVDGRGQYEYELHWIGRDASGIPAKRKEVFRSNLPRWFR